MYELVAVSRTPQIAGPPLLTEIGPIVAPTITWARSLSRPGSIAFSCTPERLPADVRSRLLDLARYPTEVWLRRDGQIVHAGAVTGYQMQGSTLTVTAPGLLSYLGYMLIDSDLTFTGVDQTAIGRELVDQWQRLPYGHFGIGTSSIAPSGVLRDRTYVAAEQHEVLNRLTQLGAAVNGFDIDLDPATRALQLVSPRQGADLSGAVVLDGRNITDAGVVVSVAAGDVASEAFGLGGGSDTAIATRRSNRARRAMFGRAGVTGSFDGVTQPATLDAHTQALLDARAEQLFLPGPGLIPVADADVDSFGVGDTVTYTFDAGLGVQSGVFRVVEREVSVNADGAESMAVRFA
jgi:hypothetical protein